MTMTVEGMRVGVASSPCCAAWQPEAAAWLNAHAIVWRREHFQLSQLHCALSGLRADQEVLSTTARASARADLPRSADSKTRISATIALFIVATIMSRAATPKLSTGPVYLVAASLAPSTSPLLTRLRAALGVHVGEPQVLTADSIDAAACTELSGSPRSRASALELALPIVVFSATLMAPPLPSSF